MDTRHLIWIGVIIGGGVGSWIPTLWGSGMLSLSSVAGAFVGALVGIYLGAKLASW